MIEYITNLQPIVILAAATGALISKQLLEANSTTDPQLKQLCWIRAIFHVLTLLLLVVVAKP